MKFRFFKRKKETSNGGIKEIIAKLSRGLMLPIAMLPIAGIFLGVGAAIVNNVSQDNFLYILGSVLNGAGNVVFSALPVLFAVAIAITFTGDAGVAGLSAFVGWIVFCALQSALIISHTDEATKVTTYNFLFYKFDKAMYSAIFTSNVGIQSLSTSVFGGISIGFLIAFLYNKYKNIQLPTIIGFFSGVRFIPIITFLSSIILSLFFSLIWPGVGQGLYWMGVGLGEMGEKTYGFNCFLQDFISRSLCPFGLHHAFYSPLWYTNIGGNINLDSAITINGVGIDASIYGGSTWSDLYTYIFHHQYGDGVKQVSGDQSIWMFLNNFAGREITLADQTVVRLTFKNLSSDLPGVYPAQYMQGKYSIMIFALPAAALAMVLTVPKGANRKVAASVILSAGLTSLLTGITEPIEFTFLFLAPWLFWGFHAVFCGLSGMLMYICGAHIGMTFSGGLLDLIIYGVIPDISKAGTNFYWAIVLGIIFAPIYFVVFYFSIIKFDIKTPGRNTNAEIKMYTKKDYLAKKEGSKSNSGISDLANEVIKAYGGKENIKNVDACITKLRIQVADPKKVNKARLMELGARGVMYPSKQSVYAVFGTDADRIKNEIKSII